MDTQPDSAFDGRITPSHVYALGQGAVITTPLLLSQEQFLSFTLKPGDQIDVHGAQLTNAVRCRILDIESVNAEPEYVLVRLTLEASSQ